MANETITAIRVNKHNGVIITVDVETITVRDDIIKEWRGDYTVQEYF